MERQICMEEVSDGRLYGINDMVKADCHDCAGCSACCQGMGSSILLDPLDIFRLSQHLNRTFEGLLEDKIELNVVDGVILPNLKMQEDTERCVFLDETGRCSVHAFRPGICRIFPLGRIYENHSFQYFLQVNECKNTSRSKIKVKKWIDTPEYRKNEQFITDWHYYLKGLQKLAENTQDGGLRKEISMYVLNTFYLQAYDPAEDFYSQFGHRLSLARSNFRRQV